MARESRSAGRGWEPGRVVGRMGGCANGSCLCGGVGAGELFLAVNQHVSNPGVCKKKL